MRASCAHAPQHTPAKVASFRPSGASLGASSQPRFMVRALLRMSANSPFFSSFLPQGQLNRERTCSARAGGACDESVHGRDACVMSYGCLYLERVQLGAERDSHSSGGKADDQGKHLQRVQAVS